MKRNDHTYKRAGSYEKEWSYLCIRGQEVMNRNDHTYKRAGSGICKDSSPMSSKTMTIYCCTVYTARKIIQNIQIYLIVVFASVVLYIL